MKTLLTIIIYFLCSQLLQAQNNVFVLVDVSKSVSQTDLNNAKQALNEVLTGANLTQAFIAQGKQQDLTSFKLTQGDKLAVSKFGSLNTTLAISPGPVQIQNINADVSQALNAIAWTPTDNQTYITLAKAKIAEYAKNNRISKYKLYVISDNIQDDYGPGGKPNYPDEYTRNLAEGYNTSTNPVGEAGYTKIKFSNSSLFALSFSPNVDVSKYSLPNQPPVIIDTVSTAAAVIKITSNPGGKKDKEIVSKSDNLNVSWSCSNLPNGGKFTVMISEYDGGKFREVKKDLPLSGFNIKLPDGKFKVMVSAQNFTATSDTTFVEITTGGLGWLFVLLILAIAGGTGYYFWNKKRQEKIDVFATNKNSDDIFSKGAGSSNSASNSNSSNSEYF